MAADKKRTITITLDLNVEKGKVQGLVDNIKKDLDKGFKNSMDNGYILSLKKALADFSKEEKNILSSLGKPHTSTKGIESLTKDYLTAINTLSAKLFSLQGNFTKTFNSISNTKALSDLKALEKEINGLVEARNRLSSLGKQKDALGSKTLLQSQISTAKKNIKSIEAKGAENLSKEDKKAILENQKLIEENNAKLKEKEELMQQILDLQKELNVSTLAELDTRINQKTASKKELEGIVITPEQYKVIRGILNQAAKNTKEFKTEAKGSAEAIKENAEEVDNLNQRMEDADRTFGSIFTQLLGFSLSITGIISGLKRVIHYSFDYVRNLDKALTEISVVSGKSRSEVLKLTDTFIELSAKTGMAIDDIAQASTIFYQQGLNDEAVKKMTEYTAIFAKISNEDVPTAADQITAAINGFGFSVDQVSDVIDKMSVLAAYSAADINELATAMSKGASQASVAGLSFDQYNAYLATMIETTREAPENLGTSLKTIMSRFQQIKTGDNTEDDTDVNAVEKALRTVNVALRDTDGQLRDLGDVLNDLGPKWKSLDRNTQVYLGTVIAGTRQQSRFMSLMEHWDRALYLTEAAENSAGAAAKMHARAMQGLEASINNLVNAWQKLISNLANSDTFKVIINIFTNFVKWLGNGNSVLKLITMAMILLDARAIKTSLALNKQNIEVKNLNNTYDLLKKKIQSVGLAIRKFATEDTTEAVQGLKLQEQQANATAAAYNNLMMAQQGGSVINGVGNLQINRNVSMGDGVKLNRQGPIGTVSFGNTVNQTKTIGGALSKFKTGLSAAAKALGTIQVALTGFVIGLNVANTIIDALTTTAEEMKEKAQKAYDKVQEDIDKREDAIKVINTNIDLYEKLNKKLNKTTEELDQMRGAAREIAEVAPKAIKGYDLNGNPIIDANAAAEYAKESQNEVAENAKKQIKNIGNLGRAEIRGVAEESAKEKGDYKLGDLQQNAGKAEFAVGTAALATTLLTAGTTSSTTGVGAIIGIPLMIMGGALMFFGSKSKEAAISAEEYAMTVDKANEIIGDKLPEIQLNLSRISKTLMTDQDINGVSANQRMGTLGQIQSAWGQDYIQQAFDEMLHSNLSEEMRGKIFEQRLSKMGSEWEKIVNEKLGGEKGLAKITKQIEKIADGVGGKTYASVESAVEKFIKTDLKISKNDPLFNSLKEAFLDAAFDGTSSGIKGVIKDLEKRKNAEKDEAVQAEYQIAIDNTKGLTNDEIDFYANSGLTDNVLLYNKFIEENAEHIKDMMVESTEEASIEMIAILSQYKAEYEKQMDAILAKHNGNYKKLSKEEKEEYNHLKEMSEDATTYISNLWGNLDYSSDIPWKNLFDQLEKIEEKADSTYSTLGKLLSGDGIDYSTWKDWTSTVLDNIDVTEMSVEQLERYTQALDDINNSMYIENGLLKLNGDALQNIGNVEEEVAAIQKEAMRQQLINKRDELQAEKAVVDAEIASLKYRIAEAKGSKDAAELKTQAENAWGNAKNEIDKQFIVNNEKVVKAFTKQYTSSFAAIGENYNKLITGFENGKVDINAVSNFKEYWKNATKDLTFEAFNKSLDKSNLKDLELQLASAEQYAEVLNNGISNINLKLKTLDIGFTKSTKDLADGRAKALDKDKVNEYIGKLKEIYNWDNKIATIEHRLGMLDKYREIRKDTTDGGYLKQQIELTKEELRLQNERLVKQKEYTNGMMEYIKQTEVGDVFDFDKSGTIIINWEKYLKLQNETVDGNKSLMEQADELYDTYTSMYDGVKDYADDYLDTIVNLINKQQEILDAYKDMSKKTADAIKEVYQKELDAKLEAIDKEMKALEELEKARNKANKERDNAKELSGYQADLQRAMMDTSGASDSNYIKAQQNISDKLDEMAEDKYSEMIEDIKNQLEEEKDVLQKNFDDLFSNLDWLYDMIDNGFINNFDNITALMMQTDNWNQMSSLERQEQVDEWKDIFGRYVNENIFDIYEQQKKLREEEIPRVEEAIKTSTSAMSQELVQAISQGLGYIASNSGNGNITGNPRNYTPTQTPTTTQETYTKASIGAFNVPLSEDVKNGTFSPVSDESDGSKHYQPNNIEGHPLDHLDYSASHYGIYKNSSGYSVGNQNVWYTRDGGKKGFWIWNGTIGRYENVMDILQYNGSVNGIGVATTAMLQKEAKKKGVKFAHGGFANFTGPAWLDGTSTAPEAVLDALQTKHFVDFTNTLDKMYSNVGQASTSSTASVTIDNISFNVESMSSPEDGEKAFNAFVDKFKEIGDRTGLKVQTFKNTL